MSGLVALDIHTGKLRWQAQAGENGIRPILVDGLPDAHKLNRQDF